MNNEEKWADIIAEVVVLLLRIVGGLAGLAILVVVPVATIYGFVAGLIYVVVKTLQTMGVL